MAHRSKFESLRISITFATALPPNVVTISYRRLYSASMVVLVKITFTSKFLKRYNVLMRENAYYDKTGSEA
jgi:hypothetical protein